MTDQELIHGLHTFAGKPADYAELVCSPVPSSYGISFVYEDPESYCMVAAAERIEEKNATITALQSENAEKHKEIERLKGIVDAYATSARSVALWLGEYCDRSLPYDKMILEAAQKAAAASSRVTAERDEALKDCSGYCATCAFVEDCAKHDNNDATPPVWYYGDCDDWMWRGTQKEDNDG